MPVHRRLSTSMPSAVGLHDITRTSPSVVAALLSSKLPVATQPPEPTALFPYGRHLHGKPISIELELPLDPTPTGRRSLLSCPTTRAPPPLPCLKLLTVEPPPLYIITATGQCSQDPSYCCSPISTTFFILPTTMSPPLPISFPPSHHHHLHLPPPLPAKMPAIFLPSCPFPPAQAITTISAASLPPITTLPSLPLPLRATSLLQFPCFGSERNSNECKLPEHDPTGQKQFKIQWLLLDPT